MPDPTYDALKPLIHEERREKNVVVVTFRCPETGVEASTTQGIRAGTGIKATAVKSAKRSLW